jgi:hypothetical protein
MKVLLLLCNCLYRTVAISFSFTKLVNIGTIKVVGVFLLRGEFDGEGKNKYFIVYVKNDCDDLHDF